MKLLKVFGIVVGVHVFALILIFANPGCSSTTQTPPAVTETAPPADAPPPTPGPAITLPSTTPSPDASITFDPNAPAVSVGIRYSPTRPNTAAAGALEAEPVSDVTPATTYTVGKRDSLWTIAKKNHLTVSELAAANNLKPGASVRIGQKLIVPGKSASPVSSAPRSADAGPGKAPAAASAMPTSGDSVKHTVKAGETLGAIARKYGVKVGDIATANNIVDPKKIRPGMELVIPGWQSPPGKASRAVKASPATAPAPAPASTPTPTIAIPGEDQSEPAARPAPDAPPPTISVEDVPPPKQP